MDDESGRDFLFYQKNAEGARSIRNSQAKEPGSDKTLENERQGTIIFQSVDIRFSVVLLCNRKVLSYYIKILW